MSGKVEKLTSVLVRDLPALLVTVSRPQVREESIPYAKIFAEYQRLTTPGKRILLVYARSHKDAFDVAFVLGLYSGFDVVAMYDPNHHAFRVGPSFMVGSFPYESLIHRDDIHAVHAPTKSA